MNGSSLGPLTLRQRLFWIIAVAVLIADLAILIAVSWPANFCGGQC